MAVNQEIWLREITKRLFKNNMFLDQAYREDANVLGGVVCHIPQPGAAANVVKNRNSYPATTVRRTDTDITYNLDEYSTDPTHIPDIELETITYDKVGSVLDDHFGYLMQELADDQIIKWTQSIPQVNIINTSGEPTAALEVGQNGLRAAFRWQDLRDASRVMNKGNVPQENRFALIEENMFQQLVDSVSATAYKDFSKEYDVAKGTVGTLFGFNIMRRSTVIAALAALDGSNNLQVNALDSVMGATDNVGAFCFQMNAIGLSLGAMKMFQRENDPQYYGNIWSTSIRAGGRRRRGDDKGVVAIMQGATNGN